MKFKIPYKKIVYGYFELEAKSLSEAKKKAKDFNYAEADEFENKSDYELGEVV